MSSNERIRAWAPRASGALALVGALTASLGLASAQEARPSSPSAKLFESSCSSCHTVPDARFPTDKAWLGQVLETA